MNNREFKEHLQAIAHSEKPREENRPPLAERKQPRRKEPDKKPPVKSKLGQLRMRRKAM